MEYKRGLSPTANRKREMQEGSDVVYRTGRQIYRKSGEKCSPHRYGKALDGLHTLLREKTFTLFTLWGWRLLSVASLLICSMRPDFLARKLVT
jgi:hypothetical protein